MKLSTLLSLLLGRYLRFGVVAEGGGGAADENERDEEDDQPGAGGASDADPDAGAGGDAGADDEDPDAEIVVSLGDEAAVDEDDEEAIAAALGDTPSNAAFAKLRRHKQDLKRQAADQAQRIRDLETQLAAAKPAEPAIEVGAKPTMEGCDFDAEKFEAELEAWHGRKREADEAQRRRTEAQEQEQRRWHTRIEAVDTAAAALKVSNREEAESIFKSTFSLVQQGIVMGGPEDAKISALLRHALGANPAKARELAAIKDPVKFTFAVAKLETQMKVTPRKTPPPPERVVRSAAHGASAVENQSERLREEARKTGDFSKVIALRRQQKAKQTAGA